MEPLFRWLVVIILSSLIYGNLSALISMRRLYFLASAAPHSALLAVSLAVVLVNTIRVFNEYLWSSIIGCVMMLLVGYMIYKGADTDIVTSVYVASSASLSILVINYVLTGYGLSYSLWSIILGDPLLTTWGDVINLTAVALLTIGIGFLIFNYHLYIGVDPDFIKIAVKHRWVYELLIFMLLGLASVALIKVSGFILQHILMLLPSTIAINLGESAKRAYVLSILISLIAGCLGLYIAILVNIAPSGAIGLILLLTYVITLAKSR